MPALQERGHQVVACARHKEVLDARGWESVETRAVDLLEADSIGPALRGCEAAYYLVHSMSGGAGFAERDRQAASNFAAAAAEADLQQIVYLGGLQPAHGASEHLRSRGQTGDTLREGPAAGHGAAGGHGGQAPARPGSRSSATWSTTCG
ncbi:MAG: NAD(P)H-binding protein [Dehalococcoidia bacterium]|nr:NAD(P)H-binding protein [Dehalococcoidia bacterium]